jgi:hypothetical protein
MRTPLRAWVALCFPLAAGILVAALFLPISDPPPLDRDIECFVDCTPPPVALIDAVAYGFAAMAAQTKLGIEPSAGDSTE